MLHTVGGYTVGRLLGRWFKRVLHDDASGLSRLTRFGSHLCLGVVDCSLVRGFGLSNDQSYSTRQL